MDIEDMFLPVCMRGKAWAERDEGEKFVHDDASRWGFAYDEEAAKVGAYYVCPECLPYLWIGRAFIKTIIRARPHLGCADVPRKERHGKGVYTS